MNDIMKKSNELNQDTNSIWFFVDCFLENPFGEN